VLVLFAFRLSHHRPVKLIIGNVPWSRFVRRNLAREWSNLTCNKTHMAYNDVNFDKRPNCVGTVPTSLFANNVLTKRMPVCEPLSFRSVS